MQEMQTIMQSSINLQLGIYLTVMCRHLIKMTARIEILFGVETPGDNETLY